jgi:Coenzyme PQQ synthesis protein D (PqqD)
MFRDWIDKTDGRQSGSSAATLCARADVRAVAVADGLAVLDMGRGTVFKANAVGAEIWRELIEQQRDTESVAETLAGRFDVSPAQAREDVNRFVGQLCKEGLVSSR